MTTPRQFTEQELNVYQNLAVIANLDQKKNELLTSMSDSDLYKFTGLDELNNKGRGINLPDIGQQYRVQKIKLSVMRFDDVQAQKLDDHIVMRSKDTKSCVMAYAEVRYHRTRKNRLLGISTVKKHLQKLYNPTT